MKTNKETRIKKSKLINKSIKEMIDLNNDGKVDQKDLEQALKNDKGSIGKKLGTGFLILVAIFITQFLAYGAEVLINLGK